MLTFPSPRLPVVHCLLLLALLCVGASPVALAQAEGNPADAVDADEAAMAERLAACAICHGENGEGRRGAEYYPHLSGKPAGYLFDQLRGFRDGRRHYAQMSWLLRFTDDGYLRRIADFYAAQPPQVKAVEPAVAMDPALRRRAEQLVYEGDPGRELPACVACHGQALTGMEPGIPALVGLPVDYLIAQLGAWRVDVRRGAEPDCMAHVARGLADTDLRSVATWLSRHTPPSDGQPLPAGSLDLPLPCGGAAAQGPTP